MDEILSSVDCASNRWQILVRKNWIVEFNSLCGSNAINANLTLNYASVEDFRNLSKMFAEAADYFEKEEKEMEEKIKYLENVAERFKQNLLFVGAK